MKLLIIDNAEPIDREFNAPLFGLISKLADCDIVSYINTPPPNAMQAQYDAAILSGAPLHYSFEMIDQRTKQYGWILQTSLPVLGVCLGHQIIGELFGGKILHQKEVEKGVVRAYIDHDDPLLAHMHSTFETFMMHRASVTLPRDFIRIAHTNLCDNVVMKHKTKSVYGVQAHPELSQTGKVLFRNFITLVKRDTLAG